MKKLFPSPLRADFSRRTDDPAFGGLNGDLAILIGLLGFSVYDGAVVDVMERCIRAVNTSDSGWRIHNRHDEEGWTDRRGFAITVWAWPPYSTTETLHALEQGVFGNIWS